LLLGAEYAATRKVTDRGWMPHSRQVGVTARAIAPDLYVALGMSGNPNHMVGVDRARIVVAVNTDPEAAILSACDVGIVADWRDVVENVVEALTTRSQQHPSRRR
jgi:electron transfer flavoprotein alpha subunit